MIRAAADGSHSHQDEFARLYEPVVRCYLGARFRGRPTLDVEDAVQEVFVECLRQGGALQHAEPHRSGGFRAFLFGVARNVARRLEERAHRTAADGRAAAAEPGDDEQRLTRIFDRSYAQSVLRQAAALQRDRAANRDEAARRRVELLRLRFEEDLPIRTIAAQFGLPAAAVHHEYARAREEFRDALLDIVSKEYPDSRAEAERECRSLLGLLA